MVEIEKRRKIMVLFCTIAARTHHPMLVTPAKAGVHVSTAAASGRWIPAFASRRNFVPAGGRRSVASPRAGMTIMGMSPKVLYARAATLRST
jgi:hypothetical protein